MGRLRIDVHTNDKGVAVGGAWTWYQPADQRVAGHVFPQFEDGVMEIGPAAFYLAMKALGTVGHQLAF